MPRPIDAIEDLNKLAELQLRVLNKFPAKQCKPWAKEDEWTRIIELTVDNITNGLQDERVCCQFHAICELTMYYFLCGWEAALMNIEQRESD
jgi:hypothetical protein